MSDASRPLAQVPTTDAVTNATNVVDYAHHEIHDGSSFYVYAVSADLDTNGTLDITVITPDTLKWNHTLFVSSGSVGYALSAYEGAITDAAGSPFIPINRNRNSDKVSGCTARTGDTFTSLGVLAITFEAGGSGNKQAGTIFGVRDELILKRNTQYLFRLASREDNNRCTLFVDWYEHTNK
jgi:hypothetical protein